MAAAEAPAPAAAVSVSISFEFCYSVVSILFYNYFDCFAIFSCARRATTVEVIKAEKKQVLQEIPSLSSQA